LERVVNLFKPESLTNRRKKDSQELINIKVMNYSYLTLKTKQNYRFLIEIQKRWKLFGILFYRENYKNISSSKEKQITNFL
jgi:hypothetical protein